MINIRWKSFKHRDICSNLLHKIYNRCLQWSDATYPKQMTGLQQQDDMYDTKTQRHQIAAKTYRGVELDSN